MNDEIIVKLLRSSIKADIILAMEYLFAKEEPEIIKFFDTYGEGDEKSYTNGELPRIDYYSPKYFINKTHPQQFWMSKGNLCLYQGDSSTYGNITILISSNYRDNKQFNTSSSNLYE